MTKKKTIFTRLFVALVALTLISCCFLGSTFARYTTGGNGKASVDIAKWDINFIGNKLATSDGTTEVAFGTLSPNKNGYEATSGADSVNELGAPVLVATIENAGEVDALVTLTAGALEFWDYSTASAQIASWDEYTWSSGVTGDAPSEAQVNGVFEVEVFYTTEGETWQDSYAGITDGTSANNITLAAGDTLYVFASVTWTTKYSASTSSGELEDAIDTWIGENVQTVRMTIDYKAVQASELSA